MEVNAPPFIFSVTQLIGNWGTKEVLQKANEPPVNCVNALHNASRSTARWGFSLSLNYVSYLAILRQKTPICVNCKRWKKQTTTQPQVGAETQTSANKKPSSSSLLRTCVSACAIWATQTNPVLPSNTGPTKLQLSRTLRVWISLEKLKKSKMTTVLVW